MHRSLWKYSTDIFTISIYLSMCHCVSLLSHVRLFVTPWTVANQAPPSMGFSRQVYWSGLPFPCPGDLPDPGIEPRSPALQADALPSKPPGKPLSIYLSIYLYIYPSIYLCKRYMTICIYIYICHIYVYIDIPYLYHVCMGCVCVCVCIYIYIYGTYISLEE